MSAAAAIDPGPAATSPEPGIAVEIVHAAVPGRVRLRIRRLKGDRALARAVEQRFALIAGVRSAMGNVTTASVLLACDPTLNASALLPAFEHALAELMASWRPREALPTLVALLPVREATLPDVLGALGRLVSRLVPSGAASEAADTPGAPVPIEAANTPPWHTLSIVNVFAQLQSSAGGLDDLEVRRRRTLHGPNALPSPPRRSKIAIMGAQFKSVPVAMLGASAVLSAATGGLPDAVAILAVVLVNARIGHVTESNAERIIDGLDRRAPQDVDVLRAGRRQRIPPEAVVPGDLLVLAPGAFVAADARLLESDGLVIDESALTGESVPVHKSAAAIGNRRMPLADRLNMVFRGTLVTGGSGRALIVAIGAGTQIGQVQSLVTPYGRARCGAGPRAGTLAFTVLAITQLLHVISSRSERHSIFDRERLPSNKYIPLALGGGVALQVLATLLPGARRLLGVVPLGLADWGVVGASSVGPLLANESVKLLLRESACSSAGGAVVHAKG